MNKRLASSMVRWIGFMFVGSNLCLCSLFGFPVDGQEKRYYESQRATAAGVSHGVSVNLLPAACAPTTTQCHTHVQRNVQPTNLLE